MIFFVAEGAGQGTEARRPPDDDSHNAGQGTEARRPPDDDGHNVDGKCSPLRKSWIALFILLVIRPRVVAMVIISCLSVCHHNSQELLLFSSVL